MSMALVAHEWLQLLLLRDVGAALAARTAGFGQAWGEGKARARVRRQVKGNLGLFSDQRVGR